MKRSEFRLRRPFRLPRRVKRSEHARPNATSQPAVEQKPQPQPRLRETS
ncbi:MAG TPA: hypothetical protein VFQ38_15510 [Longimicrobiales bacterium]|nr:hypothetical protein [Longimicrobiales bacterium]